MGRAPRQGRTAIGGSQGVLRAGLLLRGGVRAAAGNGVGGRARQECVSGKGGGRRAAGQAGRAPSRRRRAPRRLLLLLLLLLLRGGWVGRRCVVGGRGCIACRWRCCKARS